MTWCVPSKELLVSCEGQRQQLEKTDRAVKSLECMDAIGLWLEGSSGTNNSMGVYEENHHVGQIAGGLAKH